MARRTTLCGGCRPRANDSAPETISGGQEERCKAALSMAIT
jgi:hypothetical protein